MHILEVIPAGVVRGLSRVQRRIGRFLADGPFLFLGIVLGIALTFRLAIGWAKEPPKPPPPTASSTALPAEPTTAEASPAVAPAAPMLRPEPRRR